MPRSVSRSASLFVIASAFVLTSLFGLPATGFISDAEAGYKSTVKQGVYNRSFHRKYRHGKRARNAGKFHGRKFRKAGVYQGSYNRTRSFNQRRRDIARRNERVVIENALQSARRSGVVLANPVPRFSDQLVLDPREGVLSGEFNDNGTAGAVARATQPCPSNYNCGYRVYSDGTGPRIITPGVGAGNGLPPFDGVSGPSIITPYD
ncbi:MAG: hypothetical protein ACR2O3_07175 [Rhizobiaceae bacterium]